MHKPRFACPHPPLMQPESPGILGVNDSASPDRNRVPDFTPGPVGVNDRADPAGRPLGEKLMLQRLNSAWDELEAARNEVLYLWTSKELTKAVGSDPVEDLDKKREEAWNHLRKLTIAYGALMTEYFRDYYDPKAAWGATLRIGWIMQNDVLNQLIGDADDIDTNESFELTTQLAVQHCRAAFEHYWETRDAKSLFYFLTLAAEITMNSEEKLKELPFVVRSWLLRAARDTRPAEFVNHRKRFIDSLISGLKPRDPLWVREIAIPIEEPKDPIRDHWERSKWEGV
jgi:hypothetical protein